MKDPNGEDNPLTEPICRNGIEMLKSSFMLAYQTSRTLVMIAVPRLPWSEERFQTPFTVSIIVS